MPKLSIRKLIKDEGKSHNIRTVSLIVTKSCNLRCLYCYEKHNLRDNNVMDLPVAKDAISRYMMADDDYDTLEIEFFGGEPFLEFQFIKEVVDWFHKYKWPKTHMFLIGTNGTILTDDMKNWLIENKNCVNVGISIDGTRTAHNISRDNSYDMLKKNLSFFKDNWPQQSAKMTICAETIPYVAESIIELEENGLNFTANIGFEDIWGDQENKKRLLGIYEQQLDILVEYYADRPDLYPVSPILEALPEYLYLPDYGKSQQKEIKRFCGAGHEMVVIDINGNTFPCHRFLPWVSGRQAPKENANCQRAWKPDKCAQCKLILSCPTCAGFNWEINGDTGTRTTYHCDSFKLEVMASAKLEAIKLSNRFNEIDDLNQKEKRKIKDVSSPLLI
jgi:uncharacterized protein